MEVVNFSLEDFCSNTAQSDCPGDPPEMEANNSSPEDFYSSTAQPDGPWSFSEMGNVAPEHGVLSDTCWFGLSLPIAAMDSISPEMGTPAVMAWCLRGGQCRILLLMHINLGNATWATQNIHIGTDTRGHKCLKS